MERLLEVKYIHTLQRGNCQAPGWEDNLHSMNPVPQFWWEGCGEPCEENS